VYRQIMILYKLCAFVGVCVCVCVGVCVCVCIYIYISHNAEND
jgi:hypothetical protein